MCLDRIVPSRPAATRAIKRQLSAWICRITAARTCHTKLIRKPNASTTGAAQAAQAAVAGCFDHVRGGAQGIAVSMVNPGAVKTPIWSKATGLADELLAAGPPQAAALYGRLIQQVSAFILHQRRRRRPCTYQTPAQTGPWGRSRYAARLEIAWPNDAAVATHGIPEQLQWWVEGCGSGC